MNPKNYNSFLSKDWSKLFRFTALMTVVMLILIPVQVIIFVVSPPPGTIEGFFHLYNKNWMLGLLSLDFLYIINNVILIFIYLALFVKLFDERPSNCLVAFVMGIVSIANYFPTNPSFEMLTLSTKYFNSVSIDKTSYLAAGEALIACYTGTGFDVYYVLGAITLILYSVAIIKSKHFDKTIGIWGLLSGILMIIPSSAGLVGMIFSLLSLIPWIVFLFMLVRCFNNFSKKE